MVGAAVRGWKGRYRNGRGDTGREMQGIGGEKEGKEGENWVLQGMGRRKKGIKGKEGIEREKEGFTSDEGEEAEKLEGQNRMERCFDTFLLQVFKSKAGRTTD